MFGPFIKELNNNNYKLNNIEEINHLMKDILYVIIIIIVPMINITLADISNIIDDLISSIDYLIYYCV